MGYKKIYFCFIIFISLFVFSGCEDYVQIKKVTLNGNTIEAVNGLNRYEITTGLNNIKIFANIDKSRVKKVKLIETEYEKGTFNVLSNNPNKYECFSPSSSTPYEDLKNIKLNRSYEFTFYGYSDDSCTQNVDTATVFIDTFTENPPNEQYISVENIKSKLGSWSYTNKSNGVEVSCASYGIADKEENIPLCIALARVGSSASDCADFLKIVYQKATGNKPDSIYTKGTYIAEYTSSQAKIPSSSLKDGDLITLYNGSSWSHIGMVFYWDAKGEWYTVSGNMSGKVKLYTVQELLNYSNRWTRYIYRSQ